MIRLLRVFALLFFGGLANLAVSQGVWMIQDSLTTKLSDVFFLDQNQGWIVTETDTILHTTDGGAHWEIQLSGSDYALTAVQFLDEHNGWAVGDLGTILHTTDGGQTWDRVESDVYDLIDDIQFVDETNGWAIGENGLIMKTTDGGATWTSTIFPADSAELKDVIFVDRNHGWISGSLDEASLVLRTTDGGESWETVWHDTLVCNFTSVFFIDSLTGWVGGMRSAILKTTDGGLTWQVQNLNPEEDENEEGEGGGGPSHIRDLFFVNENFGFAAGHKGSMLYTMNGGETWSFLPVQAERPVNSLSFVDEEHGWAITSAGGAGGSGGKGGGGEGDEPKRRMSYILTFRPMPMSVRSPEADGKYVSGFELYGNYPNPFNPSTTISYSVAGTSPTEISLIVYNLLGNPVRTLVNGSQQPGFYRVVWDGRDDRGALMPSGIYFCRLSSEHLSKIIRMTLLY